MRIKATNTLTEATITGTTTAELILFEPKGFVGSEVPVGEADTWTGVAMDRISAIVKAFREAKSETKNTKRRIVRR